MMCQANTLSQFGNSPPDGPTLPMIYGWPRGRRASSNTTTLLTKPWASQASSYTWAMPESFRIRSPPSPGRILSDCERFGLATTLAMPFLNWTGAASRFRFSSQRALRSHFWDTALSPRRCMGVHYRFIEISGSRLLCCRGQETGVITRAVARPPLTHIGIGVIDTVYNRYVIK